MRGQGKGGKWKGEGNCKEKKRKWVEDRLGRLGKGGKWKGQRGGEKKWTGRKMEGKKCTIKIFIVSTLTVSR